LIASFFYGKTGILLHFFQKIFFWFRNTKKEALTASFKHFFISYLL